MQKHKSTFFMVEEIDNEDGHTPTLKTDRLVLRKSTILDVKDVLKLYDKKVNSFLS